MSGRAINIVYLFVLLLKRKWLCDFMCAVYLHCHNKNTQRTFKSPSGCLIYLYYLNQTVKRGAGEEGENATIHRLLLLPRLGVVSVELLYKTKPRPGDESFMKKTCLTCPGFTCFFFFC